MSISHPHHELYSKKRAQSIPLVIILIITLSFVMSSLLFNFGYNSFLQGITQMETELRGTLNWKNVFINPRGTLHIKDVSLHKKQINSDAIVNGTSETIHNRKLASVKSVEINMSPILMLKYIFLPYSKLKKYDQERLYSQSGKREKPLNYFLLKSFIRITASDIQTHLALSTDQYLLSYVQKQFLELQILPDNATILCNNISSRIETELGIFSTKNLNAQLFLSDTKGITISYTGEIGGDKLAQNVSMQLNGHINTEDFFENASMETLIEHTNINKYLQVKPINIILDKSNDNIVTNATWLNTSANIVGSYLDGDIDLSLNFDKIKTADLFHIDAQSILTDIVNDVIVGKGNFTKTVQENTLNYQLQIRSFHKEKENINIDLQGDQNYINFNNFLLNFNEQLLDVQGDLSFLNWGINGAVKVKLDKPVISVPVEGSFVFSNTPYASMGKTIFLNINDISQKPIKLEYSWLDKYLTLHLAGITKPIFNISEQSKGDYWATIQEFPSTIFTSILGMDETAKFVDSIINGNILFHKDELNNRQASYDVRIRGLKQHYDFLSVNGTYHKNKLLILKANFFDELTQIDGTVQGYINLDSLVTQPQFANLELMLDQPNKARQKYTFSGTLLESSEMRFSINQSLYVDVEFNSNLHRNISTVKQIVLVSEDFTIPIIGYTLAGTADIQLVQSKLDTILLDLILYDDQANTFALQGDYINNEGTISKLSWFSNAREFDGLGSVSYNADTAFLQLQILETRELDDSNIGTLTLQTLPSQALTIGYNMSSQDITVQANNIKIGFFTKKYSGILNTDFAINMESQISYGIIYPSQIIVDGKEITISSEFSVAGFNKNGDIAVNDLTIKLEDNIVFFPEISVNSFNSISADFVVKSVLSSVEIFNIYEGYVLFNTDTNFFNLIREQNGFGNNNFSGSIILNPVFTDEVAIKNRYRYNIKVNHEKGKTTIIDNQRKLYIVRTADNTLKGSIGDSRSIVSANLVGIINARNIDLEVHLRRFDYKTLDNEFLHELRVVELQNINLEGKLTLKGATLSPLLYGYVRISNLEAYLAYFDKDIYVPNINMLISESEISIVNSRIEIDNDFLLFNAQGRLNNYSLDFIEASVFTQSEQQFIAKQLRFGSLVLNGEFQGKAKLMFEQNNLNIDGDIFLRNSLLSNERKTIRQIAADERAEKYNTDTLYITAEVVAVAQTGVKFAWPTNSFPILKAGFAREQQLLISYDGELNTLNINGSILFDNGTLYYLSKGFEIRQLQLLLNENYTLLNPYVESLEATSKERYNNKTYDIILEASFSSLENLKVNINSDPPLPMENISALLGQSIMPDTIAQNSLDSSNAASSSGLLSSIIKLSDPVSNIGVFSRFENVLQRSLQVDYLSFKTKIVQKILEYSIDISNSSVLNQNISNTQESSYLLPYLLDNSSLEIGKYVDIIYINFQLELESATLLQNASVNSMQVTQNLPLKTTFNVELPTPFFDLTWTVDPSLFGIRQQYVPMNMLTISWQTKY